MIKKLGQPFSWAWASLYQLRRNFYELGIFKSADLNRPVISVGNLSFGGTGKTPVVVWLINYFNKMNKSVCVLTRGYKGARESDKALLRAKDKYQFSSENFGDEPVMLAKKLKRGGIIVGKNRSANYEYFYQEIQPDLILLDDGFQHLQIKRDLNIVLFDATMGIDKYFPPPMGFLRESLTALYSADAVILTRCDLVNQQQLVELRTLIKKYIAKNVPIAEVRYRATGLFDFYDQLVINPESFAGIRAVAVSALASPESFYQMLENLEIDLVDKMTFPDHHYYQDQDLNSLLELAHQNAARIILTEKDAVKIRERYFDSRLLYLGIELEFLSGESELLSMLEQTI